MHVRCIHACALQATQLEGFERRLALRAERCLLLEGVAAQQGWGAAAGLHDSPSWSSALGMDWGSVAAARAWAEAREQSGP